MRVFERSSDLDQAQCCIFICLEMRAERVKRLLFEFGKKLRIIFIIPLGAIWARCLRDFSFLLRFFFTMPLEKRISLDTKGAIIALRGEGLSLRAIGHTGNFKRRAEKNCAKGLGEDHSRLLGVTLRFNATPNASSGRCPRRTYKVLGVFQHVHVLF